MTGKKDNNWWEKRMMTGERKRMMTGEKKRMITDEKKKDNKR